MHRVLPSGDHIKHAARALLRLEKKRDRQTDRMMDEDQTITTHNAKVKMESCLKVHSNVLIRCGCSAVCV